MPSRVILTAGASGIGRAMADRLAADGATVHLCDIDDAALATLPDTLTGTRVDVANETQLNTWLDETLAALGGCDVLINNAGIAGPSGAIETLTLADWQHCLSVNLDAQFLTTARVLPVMKAQGSGSIINLSSTSGQYAVPFRAPYVAAKWAVIGLTKTIAAEAGPHGIRCNAICPGTVDSPSLHDRLHATGDYEAARKAFVARQPMGRIAQAEEIAALVVYLASDDAAFTTGQAHIIDGGWAS